MPPRKSTPVEKTDFTYTLEDGSTISLPAFNSVKPGLIRRIRKLSDVDQFFTVLEELADEDTIVKIDDMDHETFEDFQKEWFKHSGVDVGE
jgi:hypothetical protein